MYKKMLGSHVTGYSKEFGDGDAWSRGGEGLGEGQMVAELSISGSRLVVDIL